MYAHTHTLYISNMYTQIYIKYAQIYIYQICIYTLTYTSNMCTHIHISNMYARTLYIIHTHTFANRSIHTHNFTNRSTHINKHFCKQVYALRYICKWMHRVDLGVMKLKWVFSILLKYSLVSTYKHSLYFAGEGRCALLVLLEIQLASSANPGDILCLKPS